jgi:hypothetical protein
MMADESLKWVVLSGRSSAMASGAMGWTGSAFIGETGPMASDDEQSEMLVTRSCLT